MLFDDTYLTIEKPAEGIYRDRGSKFLAFAYPINGENTLKDIIARLKAAHPKANHHCWAMRLGTDRAVFRINDDGEPSGTAGRPILNTLLLHNITNVLVVVIRYFGGTLLGVPGLINSYKSATEVAISQAIIVEKNVKDIYTIQFDYLQMNEIMRIVKDDGLTVTGQLFDTLYSISIAIRKTHVTQILAKLNKLNGVVIKYDYTQ